MNTPYRRKYENGLLANPITKDEPYISEFDNRSQRRFDEGKSSNQRLFSNKKGVQLVVSKIGKGKFVKTFKKLNSKGELVYVIK